MARIDSVGIGNREAIETTNQLEDLDTYLKIAQKTIMAMAPKIRSGLAEEMLNSEDAIANIAHWIMIADCKFDGRGNKFGYRKACAQFAIKKYNHRGLNDKHDIWSIDKIIHSDESEIRLGDLLEDDVVSPDAHINQNEQRAEMLKVINKLRELGEITDLAVMYIKQYYFEDMTLQEIANLRSVSKQSVQNLLSKTLKIIRDSGKMNKLGV